MRDWMMVDHLTPDQLVMAAEEADGDDLVRFHGRLGQIIDGTGGIPEHSDLYGFMAWALGDLRPPMVLSRLAPLAAELRSKGYLPKLSVSPTQLRRWGNAKLATNLVAAYCGGDDPSGYAGRLNERLAVIKDRRSVGQSGSDRRAAFLRHLFSRAQRPDTDSPLVRSILCFLIAKVNRRRDGSEIAWSCRALYCLAYRLWPELIMHMSQPDVAALWGVSKEVISNQCETLFEGTGVIGGIYGTEAREVFSKAQMGNQSCHRGL